MIRISNLDRKKKYRPAKTTDEQRCKAFQSNSIIRIIYKEEVRVISGCKTDFNMVCF